MCVYEIDLRLSSTMGFDRHYLPPLSSPPLLKELVCIQVTFHEGDHSTDGK